MNIFFLSKSRRRMVKYMGNKHVVKMILEYAQLLSTAHHVLDGPNAPEGIYKKTHINHPMSRWVNECSANYRWLYRLFLYTMEEYTYRYGKIHASSRLIPKLLFPPYNIPYLKLKYPTLPPLCMPDEFKVIPLTGLKAKWGPSQNVPYHIVKSYRNYYVGAKSHLLQIKNRKAPKWWSSKKPVLFN